MNLIANSESIANMSIDPSIGIPSNCDQQMVDRAVNSLIQSVTQPYLSMIKQYFEFQALGEDRIPMFYELPNGGSVAGTKEAIEKGESRYCANFTCKTPDLNSNNPFEDLVLSLSSRLSSLGIPNDAVAVRFSKGRLNISDPLNRIWHLDDRAGLQAFVSFGTINNWATRILNKDNAQTLFRDEEHLKKFTRLDTELMLSGEWNKIIDKIESVAQPATLGFLYEGTKVLHRAPKEIDFSETLIEEHDYRLFMQFTNGTTRFRA